MHAASFSVAVRQTPSFAQYPMRLSMVRQYWSLVHVYLQNPARHFFGVAEVPPHGSSAVQLGVGRVSTTHRPWSQYLPVPHVASFVHAGVTGPVDALHTPFSQVKPSAQGVASQLVRHWPSAQILSSAHSLEYLHVFSGAVQAPAAQVNPPEQSFVVVHGQGPAVPPHVWHVPLLQVLLSPQSALVVHSFVAPGVVPGGEQSPDWHVSPFGQVASLEHEFVQPVAVQMPPFGQLVLPVHAAWLGAVIVEQPYASQVKQPVESQ